MAVDRTDAARSSPHATAAGLVVGRAGVSAGEERATTRVPGMRRAGLAGAGVLALAALATMLRAPRIALAADAAKVEPAAAKGPAGGGSARPSALASANLLLAGARAGGRLVAVGEYGHVLLSDDDGASWRQAKTVPTRSTLTAVFFLDDKAGWAVGHGGIVLGTADGGDTWALLAGRNDGKDALFSVWFRDTKNGLAVGPFGYAARSSDGGARWEPFEIAPGELGERHLNQIVARGKLVLIAAESGIAFRSEDAGATFKPVALPYKGSLWGGIVLADGALLLWGMRGTVLLSRDDGKSWTVSPTGTEQSLAGGAQLADGRIVVAGLNGATAISTDGGASFKSSLREDRGNAAAVLATRSGYLLLGPAGVKAP
jgi:photosystem II stability/assembly factor-like uncharacterized protein